MNYLLWFSLFSFLTFSSPNSFQTTSPCLHPNEAELAELVNEYREENDLPPIPLSKSLTIVAKAHVADLYGNKPFDESNCNPHSWSGMGKWEACCYSYTTHNGPCMWNKPREITEYQGDGFEIVMYSEDSKFPEKTVSPHEALEAWVNSKNHDGVILNKGIWAKVEWNAMGVGIHKGYAAVWFGREKDSSGKVGECND